MRRQLFADWVQAEAIEAASHGFAMVQPPVINSGGLTANASCESYASANRTSATCSTMGLRVHADTTTNDTLSTTEGVGGGPANGVAEASEHVHGSVTFTFPTFCNDLPPADGPTQLNVTGMPFPEYVQAWHIFFDDRLVQIQGAGPPAQ